MDFIYTTTLNGIRITGYTGSGGSVSIPYSISGITVVSIAAGAFANKYAISEVVIPNGVVSIEDKAFSFCTNLESVSFGNGLESIGKSAFENCYKLSSISIPNNVISIGDLAFNKCSGLITANIGDGVQDDELGYGIFYDCIKLETVIYPTTLTRIPKYTFYKCQSLSNFIISGNIETIEDYAFRYCAFSEITIPDSVLTIGQYAFSDCNKLTSITFGLGISEIPSFVCSYCEKLVDVSISASITKIGQNAFGWCDSLISISIPDNIVEIGSGVCRNCSNLETITLGTGISSIPDYSFYKCPNLTNITVNGDAPIIDETSTNAIKDVPGPVYYYDGTSGWGTTWYGLQTACLDCEFSSSSSSSSSQGSSQGSSFSSSESSGGSSQSLNNSSTSESSEIQARILPFSIRGFSWKSSGKINGHLSAVSYPTTYKNRISQAERILLDRYKIDRVALYLGERRGSDTSYSLYVDIYEADSEGRPFNLLESVSKSASEILNEGWYFFEMSSTERDSPPEGMICIVFRQEGGDDLNCIPWYYSENNDASISNKNICYISSDSVVWEAIPGISMTMKLINAVDMFSEAYEDSLIHRITTAPGDPSTIVLDGEDYLLSGLASGQNVKLIQDNLEDSSDTSKSDENQDSLNRAYIEIDHPKMITSIVMDGSGSMGWNDRRFGRLEIAKGITDYLIEKYPGETAIDIVKMGAIRVEGIDFTPSQKYGTIKIDLNSPEDTLINADGTEPSLSDGIVAYGFENLEKTHTYIISRIFTEKNELEDGNGIIDQDLQIKIPLNFSSFGDSNQDAVFQINNEGPGSESGDGVDAIVVGLSEDVNHIRRNIQVKRHLFVANLVQNAEAGDLSVEVDSSNDFSENQNINIIDSNGTDPNKTISSIDINSVSVTDELLLDFGVKNSSSGGFIQEGIVGKNINLTSETTLELLVKDSLVSRTVTFYLETSKGGRLKWNIMPFEEWNPLLLFYSDKGGKIEIRGFDQENQPLPDGTEIQFYVDEKNSNFEIDTNDPIVLTIVNSPLPEGEDTIELEDVSRIKAGDSVSLLGENQETERITGFLIDSVNEDEKSVVIFPPYDTSLFEIKSIEIEFKNDNETKEERKVFLPISAVDLTPFSVQRAADPLTRSDYDPPPTSHLITDQNTYNQDANYEVRLPMDFPAMWDSSKNAAVVALRILPVTDDVVDTEDEKREKVIAATKQVLSDEERAKIEALEDDYRIESENSGVQPETEAVEESLFTVSEQEISEDADYSIQTPILLFGGYGESSMQTFTTDMEMFDKNIMGSHTESYGEYGGIENWSQSGLLAKKYTIYPYVILKDSLGNKLAIKEVDDFDIYFASPYQIWSNIGPEDKKVNFKCLFKSPGDTPGEDSVTEGNVEIPGCYSFSNDSITIDYIVTKKGILVNDGELLVKIFDGTRTLDQMKSPEENVPDFSEELCSVDEESGTPSFDLEAIRGSIYSKRTRDFVGTYLDKVEYQQASYMDGYLETITLPIVNGRAKLTITAPGSVVAKVIVMAEFVFPEDATQSVTKQDPIWFINPLEINYYGASTFVAGHTQPLYEIGASVFFKGVPIEDNVSVSFSSNSHPRFLPGQGNVISRDDPMAQGITNFIDGLSESGSEQIESGLSNIENSFAKYGNWPATTIKPAVSKTINGIARNVYLGTHGEVVNHFDSVSLSQKGDTEVLTIKTSYLGFSSTINKEIEWLGIDENNDFKFRIKIYDDNGREITGFSTEVYSDGWRSVYILADLAASVSMYPSCDPYIDLLLGKDFYGNIVGNGTPSKVLFSGAGDGEWKEDQPLLGGNLIGSSLTLEGEKGRGYCLSKPISLSYFVEKEKCDCTYLEACFPQGTLIDVSTSVKIGDKKFNGTGCMCERDWNNDCENLVPCGDSFKTIPTRPAAIIWKEPLQGEILTFGKDKFIVNRNGEKTEVIVDITFSGEAIPIVAERNNATDSLGNRPALPFITFDIFKIVTEKDPSGNIIRTTEVRDNTISLENYSSSCLIELTSSHVGNEISHFHKCQIDANGNGNTTIEYDGKTGEEISSTHTHSILNYLVSNSINSSNEIHSHNIRSIAKTIINPTYDVSNQICLTAKFSYDASKKPIERIVTIKACDSNEDFDNGWSLLIKAPGEYNTKPSTTITDDGMDLIAELTHVVNGTPVQIPDGTRIHFDVDAFLKGDSEVPGTTRRTVVFTSDNKRPFVLLNWNASANVDDNVFVESKTKTEVNSEFSWLPNVRALVPEITTDSVFIDKALSSITTLGGSPLHDATVLAASRVINYKKINQDWEDAISCVALITDGDENLSDNVLSQGISAIKRMGNENKANAASITLGRPHSSDILTLRKYAQETNGTIIRVPERTIDGQEIAQKVFSKEMQEANSGVYRNIVDLSSEKIFKSATIDYYLPVGTSMSFKTRFGENGLVWGEWSESLTISGEIDLQTISDGVPHRFMEYEIGLIGNSDFESPRFLSISVAYIEPKKHIIVFAPISTNINSEEYIGEAILTHKVVDASSSTIRYGIAQVDSLEEQDYFTEAQPLLETGKRQILLGRHNEIATSIDGSKFQLANGPWPKITEIEVYKIVGETYELVPPSEYSLNPESGLILFSTVQNENVKLSVSLKYPPFIRIICLITNYGEEAVKIDHIGITYNTTQRVEKDEFGINRMPISDVYEMSSSSSESSEIQGLNKV